MSSLYRPTVLTAEQCRTLANLAAGDRVAIDSLANSGQTGVLVALAGDDVEYLVREDGTLQRHEAGVVA